MSAPFSSMRLQKFLATAGVDSRRNCEEYIRQGRVTVDGEVITDPASAVVPDTQDIRLDGERLRMPRKRYFLLNKPKGVLCTNHDPQGRPRAIDLVPSNGNKLFTVGRLDESTEGLLLITNDGELAERMAHPRFEVVRRYRAHVAGIPQDATLQQLRDGMYFSDGFFRFRGVRILKRKGRSALLELEMREGKNREIRRLLAKVGHKVIALERIAFGPLRIGHMARGRFRELRTDEIADLKRALNEAAREHMTGARKPAQKPAKRRPEQPAEAKEVQDVRPEGARADGARSRGSRAEGSRPDARGEARSRSKSKSTPTAKPRRTGLRGQARQDKPTGPRPGKRTPKGKRRKEK